MGLVARTEDIFYGPPMGRGSDRTTMAVVAEINDDAGSFLRSIVSGRPLSRSVIQAAANFGITPLCDGSTQATGKLLPFDGDAYGVFAFIETVALINEAQGNERLTEIHSAAQNAQPNDPVGRHGPGRRRGRRGVALRDRQRARTARARAASMVDEFGVPRVIDMATVRRKLQGICQAEGAQADGQWA